MSTCLLISYVTCYINTLLSLSLSHFYMSHPLECINDQIQNHMPKSKNCNMPVVNWCLNHGPCNAQIHPEPEFVNPWKGGCREKKYLVVHNKCDVSLG